MILALPALLITAKRRIACLKKGCATSREFVNPQRFSQEIYPV